MRRVRDSLALLVLAACARDAHVATGDAALARVRIAALLPNPRGVPDERGEWLALRNDGDSEARLDRWRLTSSGDAGFELPRGTRLGAGETLVLARSTDRRTNGDVDARIALTGITLGNRADWLALRDASGRTVDSLEWHDAVAGVTITAAPAPPSLSRSPSPIPSRSPVDPRSSSLEVRVLDVGQGDAILVRDGGSLALIDGGPDPALLGQRLDALGIGHDTTFDVVVLTHAHADHYQGLRELFRSRRRLRVRWFVENGDASPQDALRRLRDSVGARVRRDSLVMRDADDPCANGRPVCTFTLRGGTRLHVLRPDPAGDSPNDRSAIVKLVSRDSSLTMLLGGDGEQTGLRWLERSYARNPGLDVDVLKASHHGSCDGVTTRFLRLASPAAAIASLAARNDYGHMHARTKSLLQSAGVSWYRTDQNGDVVVRVPGAGGRPWSIAVERGRANMDGPSDRGARCD